MFLIECRTMVMQEIKPAAARRQGGRQRASNLRMKNNYQCSNCNRRKVGGLTVKCSTLYFFL